MVLVDSSVWIEFFSIPASKVTEKLKLLIEVKDEVLICGLILQEVLQGFKLESEFHRAQEELLKFPFIEPDRSVYIRAAHFYRELRRKGFTVPSIDVLLASLAIRWNVYFFTLDRDFEILKDRIGLRLFE